MLAAGAASLGIGGYATLIEPNQIKIEQVEIRLSRLPAGLEKFKIVVLSDFHYGPFTGDREIGAAVAAANSLRPDLIALVGDFVTAPALGQSSNFPDAMVRCARLLSVLRAPLGVHACLGNHDVSMNPEACAKILEEHQVKVLRNGSSVLQKGGARLRVAGLDDALHGHPDLDRALAETPSDIPTVLLVHEPDYADVAAESGIDVQLSGHSHGGQIRIPVLGSPYLPPMAQKYPYGYYRVRDLHLYTTRGIGTIILPMRLDAPPEVTLLTLVRP